MSIFRDEKAQISMELLLIIAAVVALAMVMITQIKTTATDARDKIASKSESLLSEIEAIE
ncbi:MAG: class III signal peptide-containing protein [Candidatus Diapherotrites archaeon]|nr:class III signal peptide-containing protein [Candidatus Diapherotrites archaeon]